MKLLLLLFISFNCYAFTPIKKGEPSPSNGFVVTHKQEKELRQKNEDQKLKIRSLSQLKLTQDQIIQKQDDMIKTQSEYNRDLSEALATKPTGFWEKTAYFMAGALLTGLVSYGTIKALD